MEEGEGQSDPANRPSAAGARAHAIGQVDAIAFAAHPIVSALLTSLSGVAVLLDDQGLVVAVNGGFLEPLGVGDPPAVLGLGLGSVPVEAATADPAQVAGTTAALAVAAAAAGGRPEARVCHMAVQREGSRMDLDMEARATPIEVGGRRFTLVTLADVSGERRRTTQEQVLLHELNNLAAGLSGALGALSDPDPAEARSAAEDLRLLVARLAREVEVQRALASGRSGTLRTVVEQVRVPALVDQLRRAHQASRAWAGKRLQVDLPEGLSLATDAALLQRLVAQMLTNAFEATPAGGEVRLSVEATPTEVAFRAWNAGAIPPAIASRVFERYFSTKTGEGRGQGTYALKVFGEACLKGQVSFTSNAAEGTTFELRLPRSIGAAVPPWAGAGDAS
jgi:signal transduction histidine kinase